MLFIRIQSAIFFFTIRIFDILIEDNIKVTLLKGIIQ